MEDQLIARYIGGLKLVIQDRLALQGVWTMTDATSLMMKVESKINWSTVCTQGNFTNQPKKLLLLQRGQLFQAAMITRIKMPLQLKIQRRIEGELQPLFDLILKANTNSNNESIMTLMHIQI